MTSPVEALLGVPNVHQTLPAVVTGGQPSAAHLAAFQAAGGRVVLDLRDPMEPRPLDEAATAASLGLTYVNVPIGPHSLTDETLDHVLEVVRGAGDGTVFMHCGSGNRVGAALLPYFIMDQELDQDEAVAQAMRVGLRSPELMEWALDYTRRHQGEAS